MARKMGLRRPPANRTPAGLQRGGFGVPVSKAQGGMPTALPGGPALPSGSEVTSASAMLALMQGRTARAVNGATPLPRDEGFVALMGPGSPLFPAPLNVPNPASGQADPRQWEYPVSWNLINNQRYVPWTVLRAAAEKVDIIRLCLKVRKRELCQLEWDFTVTKRAANLAGASTAQAKRELRDQFSEKIDDLVEFWTAPDKTNDMEWSPWLSMLLEERFVLDASTIFPRLTYGNDLASLEVVAGDTIKPLLNEYGNRPAPPAPAYQQWLWGFPRGEYHDDGVADYEATSGGLIYKPREPRTISPYGLPEVEQALVSAEVWLRRQEWMRLEYTAGTLPTTLLKTDAQIGQLTPEQYRSWNIALNEFLAGDSRARQRMQMLPAGFDPVLTQDVAERYKADYDEFLVKLLCAHMDVQPSEVGFTPSNGLGGAGFSDAQEDVTYRRSIKPEAAWLVDICNRISAKYLDMPKELTMQFLGMEAEDEAAADALSDTRVRGGRMTINEDRDRIGLSRYGFPEADMPMIMSTRGVVFLDGASKLAPPGVEIGPPQAPPMTAQATPAIGTAADEASVADAPVGDTTQQDDSAPEDGATDESGGTQAQKAELAAFGKFLAKRGKLTRPFAFEVLPKADGDLLNFIAEDDAEWAAELAKHFNPDESRGAHGRWGSDVHVDDKGRHIQITAQHRKDVKAAKLSTQQQMEYTARRFRGESHEDALAHAKRTPRKADDGEGLAKRFNPDQPRGAHGRWGEGAVSAVAHAVEHDGKIGAKRPDPVAEASKLADAYQRGHTIEKTLVDDQHGASVRKVRLSDGGSTVLKHTDPDARDEPDEVTNDYLGGLVASALGIDKVGTAKLDEDTVLSRLVPGRTGGEDAIAKGAKTSDDLNAQVAKHVGLRNGRDIGLLDFLSNNADRHTGNYLVDGDAVRPIDHTAADFSAIKDYRTGKPKATNDLYSPFSRAHLLSGGDVSTPATNVPDSALVSPFSKAELAERRANLTALKSEFQAQHALSKWQFMMAQLAKVEAVAS